MKQDINDLPSNMSRSDSQALVASPKLHGSLQQQAGHGIMMHSSLCETAHDHLVRCSPTL